MTRHWNTGFSRLLAADCMPPTEVGDPILIRIDVMSANLVLYNGKVYTMDPPLGLGLSHREASH